MTNGNAHGQTHRAVYAPSTRECRVGSRGSHSAAVRGDRASRLRRSALETLVVVALALMVPVSAIAAPPVRTMFADASQQGAGRSRGARGSRRVQRGAEERAPRGRVLRVGRAPIPDEQLQRRRVVAGGAPGARRVRRFGDVTGSGDRPALAALAGRGVSDEQAGEAGAGPARCGQRHCAQKDGAVATHPRAGSSRGRAFTTRPGPSANPVARRRVEDGIAHQHPALAAARRGPRHDRARCRSARSTTNASPGRRASSSTSRPLAPRRRSSIGRSDSTRTAIWSGRSGSAASRMRRPASFSMRPASRATASTPSTTRIDSSLIASEPRRRHGRQLRVGDSRRRRQRCAPARSRPSEAGGQPRRARPAPDGRRVGRAKPAPAAAAGRPRRCRSPAGDSSQPRLARCRGDSRRHGILAAARVPAILRATGRATTGAAGCRTRHRGDRSHPRRDACRTLPVARRALARVCRTRHRLRRRPSSTRHACRQPWRAERSQPPILAQACRHRRPPSSPTRSPRSGAACQPVDARQLRRRCRRCPARRRRQVSAPASRWLASSDWASPASSSIRATAATILARRGKAGSPKQSSCSTSRSGWKSCSQRCRASK